ncbi:MAG: NADH-quinone oxidoreductase subunit J [Acidimicrobiia bacterium]|nr:NADH-quinone oxidoreductase subunit J [Acidimicrobiia bacterium]
MTLEVIGFWILAVLLVGSALAVVLTKNLFHSVLWLALALTGTAGVFLMLQAEFLAGVQILLYAGGVVTVVVFAIVVTERLVGETLSHTSRGLVGGATVAGVLLMLLVNTLMRTPVPAVRIPFEADPTHLIGRELMTRYVLPFELLAVILLVSLLSASYFARPED